MSKLETWYKQDLKRPLVVHKHTDVFNQDSNGNLIGVEVYSDGEPVVLSGSISGYCLLADGTTVPAVGASLSGNKASVLIPQTAYSVPGPITITIKNVEGENITTLCATVGIVRQSVSGNLVNPGSVVTDWSNSINAQLQAVQDAADNVGAIVAAPFDENTAYVVGNYVTNNGNLYRITGDHAAGVTWANTQKLQCTVGTELYDLNRAFTNELLNGNAFDILPFCNHANHTHRGVTYTWNADNTVCTVNGTATGGASVYNLFDQAYAFPKGVSAGSVCRLKYSATNVKFQAYAYIDGVLDTTNILVSITSNKDFTIPSNASGLIMRLAVSSGVTANESVSPKIYTETLTNRELEAAVEELLSLINALSSDSFGARGGVADGTNLDAVRQPGYYVLSSGWSYTNSPLETGVAGILVVFPATANNIEQVIYSMGSPVNVKVYARCAILGNFFDWKEVSGEQVVNEYVSEHYENTYNITCSPTITADTNNYLASTGDNTDRTGDIQTMLNTTGACHLGPGKFVVTGVNVPDYAALIGSGDRTVIVLADSVTTGYAVKLNNFSSVYGLRINGGSTAQGSSSTVGTRHGILFEGTKQSGQSGGTTKKKSKIDKCTINNFSGGGITCTGTGVDLDSNLLISDCFVDHCGAGLYIPYYSEFHRISNCAFTYNYYGCVDNGGNNNFSNCDFSGNKIGILIDNSTSQSPNVAHGTFSGCSVNHSYSDAGVINEGTAIKLLKANPGEIFTGMQIFYGAIVLDDCKGIRFVGANVGRKVPITITDSTVVTFSDCTFKEGPTHADSTFTQSNNTVLKFTDCYLLDGTVYNPMPA